MPLSVEDVRARVETDLQDEVLERMLAAAAEEIADHAGPADSVVEHFSALGAPEIALSRPASGISEIKERAGTTSDEVTLAADDYRQLGPYRIRRLPGGTNGASYWGSEVKVTYAPSADLNLRDQVALELVLMDIEYEAAESSESGDHSESQKDFHERRKSVLNKIKEGRSPLA